MFLWTKIKLRSTKVKKSERTRLNIYPSWPPGYPTRTRELLNIASYRTSNIIILSAVSFSEAVSEPFSIARSEPSNEQEDAYDIVQAMQEVQLQAHAAPPRPVDTSG